MSVEELLGILPDDWAYRSLGEVCEDGGGGVQTGPFGSQLHASDYVSVGIPSIMPKNIGDNRISSVGIARVSIEDAERLSKYRVRPGDIVYSRRGDVERRALVRSHEDGWLCGTGCLRVRLGVGAADPAFVSFYLGTAQAREWIVRHAQGATMPNLNTSILSACPMVLPPLPEQCAIAKILGALDDKIELNRQTNETLEAMAQTLFKDWFVDFGPTRAKMAGCEPCLAPDLWALLPDRLDAQTGLPEGWEVFRLRDLAYHHKRTLRPSDFPETIFEHFSMPAFSKGKAPALDLGKTIKSNKTIVPEMSILLSKLNPEISRVWLPDPPSDYQQVSSTEFLAFTAKKPAGRSLLYCLLRDDRFRDMLQSMVTGTCHQRVSPPSLLKREVLCGRADIFNRFESIANSFLGSTFANRAEARTLAQTRNLLLPKIMSGEVRLREAEQIVGEVL